MPQRNIPAQFPRIESERALEPWGVRGLSFAGVGVGLAQVFTVSSVLGSAEGERWQAGPLFSPRHDLSSRLTSEVAPAPRLVSKKEIVLSQLQTC